MNEVECNCRSPYDFTRVAEDKPNLPVIEIIEKVAGGNDIAVIIMSGRSEDCRTETTHWLDHHLWHDFLYMRPSGDMRQDWKVKHDLYNDHVRGKFNVLAVFDDRRQVVRLWRELGLTALQVADGNF